MSYGSEDMDSEIGKRYKTWTENSKKNLRTPGNGGGCATMTDRKTGIFS